MYRLLDRIGLGGVDKGGARVVRNVESWLAARPADDRPAFTVVDVVEAEPPFHELPADVLARFTTRPRAELRAVGMQLALGGEPAAPDAIEQATTTYDAAVAYTDALLGRLVEALRRRGMLDRTILVVLSDHGELLGEHGAFGHGRSPYEPVLHVPLLVRAPGRVPADRRVETPVSTVGVFATVLDLAGLPSEPSVQVGSLRPVIDGAPHPGPVLAEQFASPPGSATPTDDPLLDRTARFRAYLVGPRKLVDVEPGGTFLFDLADDPGETRDAAMAHRTMVASLRESLDQWRERLGIPDLRAAIGSASTRERGVPEHGYAAE
jgi:arylsulfatase A-like enzyme